MLIRARVHPFPSRTRKLSSLLLTILGWRRPGKIGSANTKPTTFVVGFVLFYDAFAARRWLGALYFVSHEIYGTAAWDMLLRAREK